MKRIEFIAPVESMRGNLSGSQDLEYRENNNPAYDAPNGDAHALNYQPRFVGAKRSKDGLKYFSVRTKSTTKLNARTRKTMAILGSIAAIRSAEQFNGSSEWSQLHAIYQYRMEHGGDAAGIGISFNKWIDYWLRDMLMYKKSSLTLTASGLSVTIDNPYNAYDADALAIKKQVFAKFVPILTADANTILFEVDGKPFVARAIAWNSFKDDMNNDNYVNMFTDFTIPTADDAAVQYNGLQLYTAAGVAVKSDDAIVANEKYTTIAHEA